MLAGLLIGIGACAATPEPQETPPPIIVESQAEPEIVRPPVQPAPVIQQPVGPTPGSIADFRENVGERVFFDLNQWRLDLVDQSILQRQAAWLQSYPQTRILVAGNCDERGTREYNLALGERRANIVKEYLVDIGIDPSRIETVSYGKERPIDGRSNEAGWQMNRNGFTQIIYGAPRG